MYSTYFAPPFGTPVTVIFCRFLRSAGKQKIPISLGDQDFTIFCFSSKWCHQESNRGHKDFQSFALPTELWHHFYLFCGCKGNESFGLCKRLGNKKKVCRNARCTSFLFITIQICSFSLSCDLLKISLIYVFPASKNSSCKFIKQSNQPVHTFFCQFCTHLFYIEGNG